MANKDVEAAVAAVVLPPWRWFIVRRGSLEFPGVAKADVVSVVAHSVQFIEAGVLAFATYSIAENGELTVGFRRAFKDWLEFEEIVTTGAVN